MMCPSLSNVSTGTAHSSVAGVTLLASAGAGAGGVAGGLFGPQFITKLMMNPETRPFLEQPDFKAMLSDCSTDASKLTQYMRDPRFAKALEVGMGLSFGGPSGMGGEGWDDDEQDVPGLSEESGARSVPPRTSAKPQPPPEDNLTEEEKAEMEHKAQALKVRTFFCISLLFVGSHSQQAVLMRELLFW
jgi:hypothetical protein